MGDPKRLETNKTGQANTRVIHARLLGCYLVLCAAYQVFIYCCSDRLPPPHTVFKSILDYRYTHSTWFDFGNPRSVLDLFDFLFRSRGTAYWVSAAWLFAIAIAMIAKPGSRRILRAYAYVEVTLAVLGCADLLLTMGVRAGFGSGFSVMRDFELLTGAVVDLFFSLLPASCALWKLRGTRYQRFRSFLRLHRPEFTQWKTAEPGHGVIHPRLLGFYLTLCVAYQFCIYCFSESSPLPTTAFEFNYEGLSWLDFGNPRPLFLTSPRSPWFDAAYAGLLTWLLAIAIAMIAKPGMRIALRTYVYVELVLATLGLAGLFVSAQQRGDFRGGHSVTRDFLFQTNAIVIMLFSVLPVLYGLWILRKSKVAQLALSS